MNILDIEFTNFDKNISLNMINDMLSAGIVDDYLFERLIFSITMEKNPADLVNYMYRLLWEYVYIKSPFPSNIRETFNEEYFVIHISLSEAIGYIKATLPNNFYHAIKSIDTILNTLKVSLLSNLHGHDNLPVETHYPSFKNVMNFKPFNTIEPQLALEEKFKHLLDTNIGKVMILGSSVKFNQLFVINEKPSVYGVIELHTDKLRNLMDSGILEGIVVCNVALHGFTMHIKFYSQNMSSKLASYVKESYKSILK